MKNYMTPEEHARLHRRRARQALGLLVAVLVLIGAVTVLRSGVRAVAKLFDDTAQKQEYEDKLEGLVPVSYTHLDHHSQHQRSTDHLCGLYGAVCKG